MRSRPDDMLLPRLSALVKAALAMAARSPLCSTATSPPRAPLRRAQAAEMLRICRWRLAQSLIINDDLCAGSSRSVPTASHLGRGDAPGGPCRGRARGAGSEAHPRRFLLRRPRHVAAAGRQAAGADYVAFGSDVPLAHASPMRCRAPMSKSSAKARRFGLPLAGHRRHYAGQRSRKLIKAGADMVAVIADLFDTMDITTRAAEYQDIFIAQS
jgi:hypothetical protein